MSCNFILLTTLVILSMTNPSHTAISSPRITSSELFGPYYNASNILEVFSHDVIPQSCAPAELTRGAIHYEATAISENPQNTCFPGGATTESSVDIASVASLVLDRLIRFASYILFLGLVALFCKAMHVARQWGQQWKLKNDLNSQMNNDIGSRDAHRTTEMLIAPLGLISYRCVSSDESLDLYLLKEAFEELERHPKIVENPSLYDFASMYMLETVQRAAFMKIPNYRKVDWLRARYVTETLVASKWQKIKFHLN